MYNIWNCSERISHSPSKLYPLAKSWRLLCQQALTSWCTECCTYQDAHKLQEVFLLHRWENLHAQATLSSSAMVIKIQLRLLTLNMRSLLECGTRFITNFISDSLITNGPQSICWTSEKVTLMKYSRFAFSFLQLLCCPKPSQSLRWNWRRSREVVAALIRSHLGGLCTRKGNRRCSQEPNLSVQ